MPLFLLIVLIILAGGFGIRKALENRQRIQQEIRDEAKRQGVDASLALAIAQEESGFTSIPAKDFKKTGSWGIFQLRPGTASDMQGSPVVPHLDFLGPSGELMDIRLGVKYISWLQDQLQDQDQVIQAYNIGIENFRRGKTDPVYLAKIREFYEYWSEA